MPTSCSFVPRRSSKTRTSCSGCGKGNGRRRTAYTTLKVATLAPIPKARVSTVTIENPGLLSSIRSALRRSCTNENTNTSPWRARRAAKAIWLLRYMDDEAAPSLAEGLSREDAWLDSADKSEWTGTEHRLELAHKGIQLQIPGSADYTKL